MRMITLFEEDSVLDGFSAALKQTFQCKYFKNNAKEGFASHVNE